MSIRNSSTSPRKYSTGQVDDIFDDMEKEQEIILNKLRLVEQYEDNTDPWPMQLTLFDSFYMSQDIIKTIIKDAADEVINNQILKIIPDMCWDWFSVIQNELLDLEELQEDDELTHIENQGLNEEPEPFLNYHDHWQRYNVNVELKVTKMLRKKQSIDIFDEVQMPVSMLASSKSIVSRQMSSSSFVVNPMKVSKFNKEDKIIEREIMKSEKEIFLNEQIDFTVPHVEDPLENGMRMAYERDTQLFNLKQKNDKQRQTEQKQYQSQIAKLHNDQGKTRYTFDYEGKIMLQGQPKYEKLPTTYQAVNYDVITGKAEQPEQNIQKEKPQKPTQIAKQRVDTNQQNIKNEFRPYTYQSITEQIVLQKGVSYFDGNIKKQGPALHIDTYEHMDNTLMSQNLYNPNLGLKLSKSDYNAIISTRSLHTNSSLTQTFISKKILDNNSQISQITETGRKGDSFNLSINPQNSIFQQALNKNNQNSSISSSLANTNGSIKLNGNNQICLEEIYSLDQDSILEKELKIFERKKILPLVPSKNTDLTLTEQFHIDILSNREWGKNVEGLKRTISEKLPKYRSYNHTLPIIPKNPRDRLSMAAKLNIENGIKLPPPNVGNVVGHAYKGFKLGGI